MCPLNTLRIILDFDCHLFDIFFARLLGREFRETSKPATQLVGETNDANWSLDTSSDEEGKHVRSLL